MKALGNTKKPFPASHFIGQEHPLFIITEYRPKTAREGESHVWDG